MSLTSAQLATLKTDMAANTNTVSINGASVQIKDVVHTQDNAQVVADWYNIAATGPYYAWKRKVLKKEIVEEPGIDTDGTTVTNFTWGGATGGYIARSQGERDAFAQLFNSILACNPALANVRTGWDDIFSGSGAGAVGNRAHFRAKSRRPVTRCELLYVVATVGGPTQTGNRGTATNPDTLGLDGMVTNIEVSAAWDLP